MLSRMTAASAARSATIDPPSRPAAKLTGHVERHPPRAYLPALTIGSIWFGVASWLTLAEHQTYNSTSRDIGVYLQVLWNTAHGRPYATTLLESNRVHLAEHVAPLLALLSPLYAIVPDPRWLFVVQLLSLALSAVPVYLLARSLLGGVWAPTLVMAAYFAMPTLIEVAFDAFYPITFSALPVAWSAYLLLIGRRRPGAACALLALLIEEEVALTVIGLGLVLLARTRTRWLGLALAATAGLFLALLSTAVMPRFHEPSTVPLGQNRTAGHFDELRKDPSSVLARLVIDTLPNAARWLLAPTGGLPLLAPQVLAIQAPHAATLLLADKQGRYRRHWAAPLLPVIWLATVAGLSRLRRGQPRRIGMAVLLVAAAASYVADSSLPGGGTYEPDDIVWTDRSEQIDDLVRTVPPDASVVASRRVLGHLAGRSDLYVFPASYAGELWPPDRQPNAYVFDLTNDQTREALLGRQSPLRADAPYALRMAGPDALMLIDRPPPPDHAVGGQVGPFELLGYDLRRRARTDSTSVTLHWQIRRQPAPGTRLARVVAGTRVLAEDRGPHLGALMPAAQWRIDRIVLDRVSFDSRAEPSPRLELWWTDRPESPGPPDVTLDLASAP